MRIVWRICKKPLLPKAFSGEGSANNGGRWNSPGVPIVYAANCQSLAMLEVLAHTEDSQELLCQEYAVVPISLEEAWVEELAQLPRNWRRTPAAELTVKIGDAWLNSKRSLVLRVPSDVIPEEWNFLLNPAHPEFARVRIGRARCLRFCKLLGFIQNGEGER